MVRFDIAQSVTSLHMPASRARRRRIDIHHPSH